MKVTLKNDWFAPTDKFEVGKRIMSGQLYKRGFHAKMPDELRKYLPKSAVVHEDAAPVAAPAPKKLAETLKAHDDVRAGHDAVAARVESVTKKG